LSIHQREAQAFRETSRADFFFRKQTDPRYFG
jgi:hypothetical protein